MIIKVERNCQVIRNMGDLLHGKHHGAVYVEVKGEECESFAKTVATSLAEHRCHKEHENQEKKCLCACPIIHRVFWKGEQADRSRRKITATVVGGCGDMIYWYPIGTRREIQRY